MLLTGQQLFLISFICQGAMVLLSYAAYFPEDNLWAGLNDPCVFYIWTFSALLSAIGFCSFSVQMIYWDKPITLVYLLTMYPYAIFLVAAGCYMPYATEGRKFMTMFSLFVAALCACILVYSSVVLLGWGIVTGLMGVLAFHCTVIDLILWGFTWSNQPDHDSPYV